MSNYGRKCFYENFDKKIRGAEHNKKRCIWIKTTEKVGLTEISRAKFRLTGNALKIKVLFLEPQA